MDVLDIGCGQHKYEGAIGIDFNPESKADIIWDLNLYPYPLPENEFDLIICHDVLEHLNDVIKTMEEIHRIAKPNAKIRIRVPFMSSVNYFSDPTHKRAFTSRSFDFFIPGTPTFYHRYTKAKFTLVSVEYNPGTKRRFLLDRLLQKLANRFKHLYENRFAFIYPVNEIYFILEVVK